MRLARRQKMRNVRKTQMLANFCGRARACANLGRREGGGDGGGGGGGDGGDDAWRQAQGLMSVRDAADY